MELCPSGRELELLLDDALDPDEFDVVEAHLEGCASCQQALDRLTAFADRAWIGERGTGPVDGEGGRDPRGRALPTVTGYDVLGELGRGGHGVVYRARDLGLDRVVALKLLRHGTLAGPGECERLLAEARAAARLRHPNIVQVYGLGEVAGVPFFAMELVPGGSLARRLEGTPQTSRRAAALVEKLARAVHHAHGHGIIHRDLKPSNVLLADGDLDSPKVADFGVAKLSDAGAKQTPTAVVLGTPSYMAPEQAQGMSKEVGPAADVYALGAILYELLTGRPPFKAETPFETLLQVRERDAVLPREFRPRLERDLEAVCLKCLEKAPARRYAGADALADDLARFLAGDSVRARPPGLAAQLRRFARAYPALVRAALAVCLLAPLLAALVVASQHLWREREANRRLRTEALAEGASRHLERGEWRAGDAALADALATGHREPARIRLERVRLWSVLERAEEASAEVKHVADERGSEAVEAERLLWEGDLLLRIDHERATALVGRALERGLSRKADRLYAQGLVAESVPDALAFFERAVEEERFHPRANQMLVLTQLLLGRTDKARQRVDAIRPLFAEDTGLIVLDAVLIALAGARARAEERLAGTSARLGEAANRQAKSLLRLCDELSRAESQLAPDPTPFWRRLNEILAPEAVGDLAELSDALAVPACVRRDLGRLPGLFPHLLSAKRPQAVIDFRAICARRPEGTLHVALGVALFNRKEFAEAERVMLRAATLDSVTPIKRAAQYYALNCQAYLFMNEPRQAGAAKRRALVTLKDLMASGPPPKEWCYNLIHIARRTGQPDAARQIASDWEAVGASALELNYVRAQINFTDGKFVEAIRGAQAVLEEQRDHPGAKDLLARAKAGLREQLEQLELRPQFLEPPK